MAEYTSDWFSHHIPVWQEIRDKYLQDCQKVLEIGSYEGRSARWILDNIPCQSLACVDSWQDARVEARFDGNFSGEPRVTKLKGPSYEVLPKLIGNVYDFIYIDGSHEAPDVLTDLVHSFHLCSPRGIIVADDYQCIEVRQAVDCFVTCFLGSVEILPPSCAASQQSYMRKV